jgi:hypothetical protein
LGALAALSREERPALFLFEDFADFLEDSKIVRRLRDLTSAEAPSGDERRAGIEEVGRALLDQDKPAEALAAFDQTVEVRRRARDRFALIRLHEDLGRAALAAEDSARAATEFGRARRLSERLGLSGRLGALDADLARLESALTGRAEGDLNALRQSAAADIDALEAQWAAPLQTAPQENPEQVH